MPNQVVQLAKRRDVSDGHLAKYHDYGARRVDDTALVAGAQRQERWAIEALIHRYQAKAFAIAYRMSADEEQARDLTQEAFIKVLDGIKTFKGKSSFFTWFYRIVVNTCLDAQRKKNRWRQLFRFASPPTTQDKTTTRNDLETYGDPHPRSDPMAHLTSKALKEDIKAALAELSHHQRMVFTLKVFEGFSIEEIAQMMRIAKGTVKSHLFRATRHMRKVLGHWMVS